MSKQVRFNLAFMRVMRGKLTQREIALETGLSQKTISALETGTSKGLEFSTLAKLCEFLRCTPNDLLVLEDEQIDEPPSEESVKKAEAIIAKGLRRAMDASVQTPEQIWNEFDLVRGKIQSQVQNTDKNQLKRRA